jgi:hypothetical protein
MTTLIGNNADYAGAVALSTAETFGDALAIHFCGLEAHSVEPTHRFHDCEEWADRDGVQVTATCDDPDLEFTLRHEDGWEERWLWNAATGEMTKL